MSLLYFGLSVCIFFFLSIGIFTLREWRTCEKIIAHGVPGTGTSISCKRVFLLGHFLLCPQYEPIIKFFFGTKYYELKTIGIFHSRLKPVGKMVDIIFSEKYDYVVIKGCNFKKMYILSMLYYGIGYTAMAGIIYYLSQSI